MAETHSMGGMKSAVKGLASPAPKPADPKKLAVPAHPSQPSPLSSSPAKVNANGVSMMHDGGPVETDGVYALKAGEHVLTAPQARMARHHALMSVGMKRGGIAKPGAGAPTAGTPAKVDAAHKKPEKKMTSDIAVRPEKNQSAKIKDKTKK